MAASIAPRILHGADYYPEQWEERPEVLAADLRLMREAGITAVALGVFAWGRLEPADGRYELDWMARMIDALHQHGVGVWLATPSGAKPNWLALAHPEVRRCQPSGHREHQAGRHNHCPTSPVYRAKVAAINSRLAQRFGRHPAVQLWHISNEYGGACHCPLCFAAFHAWLERTYGTVEAMNRAWWGRFWSHWYDRFDQVTYIDPSVSQLFVDWKRFTSDQTADFLRHEIAALRPHSDRPATTNLMATYEELDYRRLAAACDIIGWDAYPDWHGRTRFTEAGDQPADVGGLAGDQLIAAECAFAHDLMRGLKPGRTFLLMESTPSQINWRGLSRLKEPGVNRLAGLQAVAHGADAVAYFQWRKGRGGCEANHGAIIDHAGRDDTRVFREVAALSGDLDRLAVLAGTAPRPQAAIIHDWEIRWRYDLWKHAANADKGYVAQAVGLYRHLWRRSVAVDVVASQADLGPYRLVLAPALYAILPGVAAALDGFVRGGGTLLLTAMSGWVDGSDLAFADSRPGPLRPLAGIRIEEMDAAEPDAAVMAATAAGLAWGLPAEMRGGGPVELAHGEGAEVLATWTSGWHAGRPAITRHRVGCGSVVWCGTRPAAALCDALVGALLAEAAVPPVLAGLPAGVVAHRRGDHLFLLNCTRDPRTARIGPGWRDALADGAPPAPVAVDLDAWGARVLLPAPDHQPR